MGTGHRARPRLFHLDQEESAFMIHKQLQSPRTYLGSPGPLTPSFFTGATADSLQTERKRKSKEAAV